MQKSSKILYQSTSQTVALDTRVTPGAPLSQRLLTEMFSGDVQFCTIQRAKSQQNVENVAQSFSMLVHFVHFFANFACSN